MNKKDFLIKSNFLQKLKIRSFYTCGCEEEVKSYAKAGPSAFALCPEYFFREKLRSCSLGMMKCFHSLAG